MEDFIEKNKKTNQHLGNVDFEVADVTKFKRPNERLEIKYCLEIYSLCLIFAYQSKW